MKKAIYLSCTLFLCASAIVGCSNHNRTKEDSTTSDIPTLEQATLVGTWNGVGYAIGQEEEYSADHIELSIEENGEYTFKNITTEENLLAGEFTIQSNNSISISNTVDDASYPIVGWEDLGKKATLECTVLNSDTIALDFNNICYVFQKEDSSLSDFSLLDQTVSDLWYSDDGSKKEDVTYELSFSDSYFELYAIPKDSQQELLGSFIYQKNKGNTYTFFTTFDLAKDNVWPDVFLPQEPGTEIAPAGYWSVDYTLTVKDNTLTLHNTLNGQDMNFYSNLIYGLETGSDSYVLCDTSFQWAFDSENHLCYFTMNPDTDTLYLYMMNATSAEHATATVCGEVQIDQEKKTLTYHFDEGESSGTSNSSEAIYKKCREMDGKKIPYTLEDKTLHITLDKNDYNFTLEDY